MGSRLEVRRQRDRYSSSWSHKERVGMLLWHIVWLLLFRPSPKPFKRWRLMLLRLFGAQIDGRPYVASSAIIKMPWLLAIGDKAALGSHAEVYNLGHITLKSRCTVAQYCYLCAGTHDLEDPELPLVTGPIVIGEEAFIGAKALVLPGVVVGTGAVVGAGSVVTRDVPDWTIAAGNPCRKIRERKMRESKRVPSPGEGPKAAPEL